MFKFFNQRRKKGQSTLEYAILIIIIIGALLSIQIYIKRGIQGRLKSAADDIGEQFSPGNTNSVITTKSRSRTLDTFVNGVTESKLLEQETTNITTNITILNANLEYWGGR